MLHTLCKTKKKQGQRVGFSSTKAGRTDVLVDQKLIESVTSTICCLELSLALTYVNNLAFLLKDQGKLTEAEFLVLEAVRLS